MIKLRLGGRARPTMRDHGCYLERSRAADRLGTACPRPANGAPLARPRGAVSLGAGLTPTLVQALEREVSIVPIVTKVRLAESVLVPARCPE
jgi:hypothetical protein